MRDARRWWALVLCAALAACEEEPDPPPVEADEAVLWLAVDGRAEVSLDGEQLDLAEGFAEAKQIRLPVVPGEHTVSFAMSGGGEAGPALAAWIHQPDGGFVASGEHWSGAEDLGGYGTARFGWDPPAMMGTTARWIAPAGGGEGTVEVPLTVGATTASWLVYPAEHTAGEPTSLGVRLIPGAEGLSVDDYRSISNTPLDASWSREMPYPRWSTWQTSDPDAEGFVEVVTAPEGVEARVTVESIASDLGGNGPYVDGGRRKLTVEITAGVAEQPVTLGWGDGEGVVAPLQARRYVFPYPRCEAPASMDYPGATLGRCPSVEVLGGEATALRVAPRGGVVATGEPLAVRVAALDAVGNLAGTFTPLLEVSTTDPGASLPQEAWFDGEPAGTAVFELTFDAPGWHRIQVDAGDASGTATVRVTEDPPEAGLYFGDIHAHTLASDGIWHAEASYRYADQVACLDFAAITDHAERLTDAEWAEAQDRAAAITREEFLLLPAYEWTAAWTMHRNVYALDPAEMVPIVRAAAFGNGDDPVTDVDTLLQRLDGGALTIPHHPGSTVTAAHGWSGFDDAVEPVVEIYSKHGSSECFGCQPALVEDFAQEPGNYVRDALAAGHRVGFIAGSDAHDTPLGTLAPGLESVFGPGDYGPTTRRGGLAAVWVEELTHAALLDALQRRRCYATTGARIALEFAVDGAPMGSEIAGDGPAELTFAVGGSAEIAEVLVVRHRASDGWTHPKLWSPDAVSLEESWVDPAAGESAIYYLHVIQADGHHAWSSPVWVDR